MKISSGILIYRIRNNKLHVFLVHPGGPFFKNKDTGAWTIPKGEVEKDEDYLQCAIREVKEEIGLQVQGNFIELNSIKQKGGKTVFAWAIEYNNDIVINNSGSYFEIVWTPGSGKKQKFPEIDKGEFFPIDEAKIKINPAQIELINRLEKLVIQ